MGNVSIKNFIIPIIWTIILWIHRDNFFFWDTIQLASKQASFFFDNNFSAFFLPDDINSGHPPFYGLLLALWWFIFGKSLLVSHLLNLLFVWGIIFQAHLLGKRLSGEKYAFLFPLILFCNPYFLGHSILVSPDNLLIFLFIGLINARLSEKKVLYIILTIALSMVSIRGIMVVGAFILTDFITKVFVLRKYNLRFIVPYIPALSTVLLFFALHYIQKNWLGFHEASPWQESFDFVSIGGYFYNLGLIFWRLIDYGNIFIAIPLLLIFLNKKFRFKDKHINYIFILLISSSIVFLFPLAGFKYLTAHRYFMPLVLLMSFIFLAVYLSEKRIFLTALMMLGLLSGNIWIYPKTISQGWDVTMAHTPFYSLVEKMNDYIITEGINPDQIGTAFPLRSASRFLYLDESKPTYHELDLGTDKFLIYSNIMNDIKEEDFSYIERNFRVKKELSKFRITIILYERNTEVKTGGTQ